MGFAPGFEQSTAWPSDPRSLHDRGSWGDTAWMGYNRLAVDDYPRIQGFRVAAELIGKFVGQGGGANDGLIYPFLHLWCHHLELSMKQLIREAELLEDIDDASPSGHDLLVLWQRLQRALGSHGDPSDLANVDRTIRELHAIHPRGEAFRYSTTTAGVPTLPGDIVQLSFERVGTALAAVANLLDAAAMQISHELEMKVEWMADQLRWQ